MKFRRPLDNTEEQTHTHTQSGFPLTLVSSVSRWVADFELDRGNQPVSRTEKKKTNTIFPRPTRKSRERLSMVTSSSGYRVHDVRLETRFRARQRCIPIARSSSPVAVTSITQLAAAAYCVPVREKTAGRSSVCEKNRTSYVAK